MSPSLLSLSADNCHVSASEKEGTSSLKATDRGDLKQTNKVVYPHYYDVLSNMDFYVEG